MRERLLSDTARPLAGRCVKRRHSNSARYFAAISGIERDTGVDSRATRVVIFIGFGKAEDGTEKIRLSLMIVANMSRWSRFDTGNKDQMLTQALRVLKPSNRKIPTRSVTRRTGVMFVRIACVILTITSCVILPNTGWAQTTVPATETVTQRVQVQLDLYVKAFNDRDTDGLSKLISPNVTYRDESGDPPLVDATSLIQRIESTFQDHPTLKLMAQVTSIETNTPDSVTVKGQTTLTATDAPDETSAFTLTMTKADPTWVISSILETSFESENTSNVAMQSLAWLVGDWTDDSTEQLHSAFEFLPGEKFLKRTISKSSGGEVLGIEVTGYDPTLGRVRSWQYFTDGTFGAGLWTGGSGRWTMAITQTFPNGQVASGTYVIKPQDENTMTVQIVSREVDGEPVPSGTEITMSRLTLTSADDDSGHEPNTTTPLKTSE